MPSNSFKTLRDFLTARMRMSHIYQPLMIRTLLTHGGRASIRQIASTFLSKDASQIEYYEEITKNMPGKVLARRGIVRREGNAFQLLPDVASLDPAEIDELVRLCDAKLDDYMEKRGAAVFAHRGLASGYVPGSIRYEVLRPTRNVLWRWITSFPARMAAPTICRIFKPCAGSAMRTKGRVIQLISGNSGSFTSTGKPAVPSATWIQSGSLRRML